MLFEALDSSSLQSTVHSPIRAQYLAVKEKHPDTILFFRMGDFYEMFDEDAELASKELEIALTRRNFGKGEFSPMAGIPHHAAESYLSRLIAKGYRVAICEQTSDPALAKGIVDRDVTRIVTPGTVLDPSMLAAKRNNYLTAIVQGRNAVGIAYIDITTGDFATTQITTQEPLLTIQQELGRIEPAEVLIESHLGHRLTQKKMWMDAMHEGVDSISTQDNALDHTSTSYSDEDSSLIENIHPLVKHVTPYDARFFSEEDAKHRLLTHFQVATLEGFGCAELPLALRAAGAVLAYVQETQKSLTQHLLSLETYQISSFMVLDAYTRRNLELFESERHGSMKGSLLWVLDKTHTPMGGRLLRKWIGQPLLDIAQLQQRQQCVSECIHSPLLTTKLTDILKTTGDLERLIQRVSQRIASPRDLVALGHGMHSLQKILEAVSSTASDVPTLHTLIARLPDLCDIATHIFRMLVEQPPLSTSEGGIIRSGVDAELDQLRDASQGGRTWIAEMEQREKARTGINALKVGYNKVFGYYIEITNANKDRVPTDYIRKQTLTNGERYITPELKEFETIVLTAHERSCKLEYELFVKLRAAIALEHATTIIDAAHTLAEMDVFLGLAEVAAKNNYVCPTLHTQEAIDIIEGRHPVIEQAQKETAFIPNNTHVSTQDAQIALLTGPNMAGKSTYLRQVALIVLLTQIGSYVPAQSASIGLVDRIFTRIGAQDDLATGQSTFMVEMAETANILHHATPKSLLILDEIGRGTSTFDGLAIAQSIIEYIHNNTRCAARTLFATHYHELVRLADVFPRIRCMNVEVIEEQGKIIFLRKIIPGGADKSYGIHVAQLAGIPKGIIHRAQDILYELESQPLYKNTHRGNQEGTSTQPSHQMDLFVAHNSPVLEELQNLHIEQLTPLEAISKLYELQQLVKHP